jgi:putative transposase
VTKYYRKVFNQQTLAALKTIFSDVCENFAATLSEFEGKGDHVHWLIHYPPKVSLAKLVNALKGVFSRLLRKNFDCLHQYYLKGML